MTGTKVNCKFRCTHIINYGEQKEVFMSAVSTNDGDNSDFVKYTPSGNLNFMVTNETPAFNFFEPGTDYRLTFEAEKA